MKRRVELPVDVVTMARRRLVNVFTKNNGTPVRLSTSGGKDSIVLMHLITSLIDEGKIDPGQLTVDFIDEEAMHEEVIRLCHDWRREFMLRGVTFRWWCMEFKHFSCFNTLEGEERFITWDRRARDVWVRQPPSFAIRSHPELVPGLDTYQDFLHKISRNCITITGVRVSESLQRLQNFREEVKPGARAVQLQPIYDWKDEDVWLYIQRHGLDFPETYLHLFQVGTPRHNMRLSQFFAMDTARNLVKLGEYSPGLMDKVHKREPNAYLAALYFDSEMFKHGNSSKARADRKAKETRDAAPDGEGEATAPGSPAPALADGEDADEVDWKARCMAMLNSPRFRPPPKGVKRTEPQDLAWHIRRGIHNAGGVLEPKLWRMAVEILTAGDPKRRAARAWTSQTMDYQRGGYVQRIKLSVDDAVEEAYQAKLRNPQMRAKVKADPEAGAKLRASLRRAEVKRRQEYEAALRTDKTNGNTTEKEAHRG